MLRLCSMSQRRLYFLRSPFWKQWWDSDIRVRGPRHLCSFYEFDQSSFLLFISWHVNSPNLDDVNSTRWSMFYNFSFIAADWEPVLDSGLHQNHDSCTFVQCLWFNLLKPFANVMCVHEYVIAHICPVFLWSWHRAAVTLQWPGLES